MAAMSHLDIWLVYTSDYPDHPADRLLQAQFDDAVQSIQRSPHQFDILIDTTNLFMWKWKISKKPNLITYIKEGAAEIGEPNGR